MAGGEATVDVRRERKTPVAQTGRSLGPRALATRRRIMAATAALLEERSVLDLRGLDVDKLDLPHMTKIIRGLFDVTKALVDREAPPVWNAAGEKVLERLTRRRR